MVSPCSAVAALLHDVSAEVDHDGTLAPEPKVLGVQIVRHARSANTVARTELPVTTLRTRDAQLDERDEHLAHTGVHTTRTANRSDASLAIVIVGDFDLADSVGQTSLIPPHHDGADAHPHTVAIEAAHLQHRHLHHAPHRRREARFGCDLLTLVRGERFTRGAEQLDAVLAGVIRARIVAEEGGLRAASILADAADRVFVNAAEGRVIVGANGTILGVEWSGSHSAMIVP